MANLDAKKSKKRRASARDEEDAARPVVEDSAFSQSVGLEMQSEDEGGEGSAFADIDESTPYSATDTSQFQTTKASEVEADHDGNDAFLINVSDDEF